ncbi:hypothetical protein [Gordonia soli]|uniref:Transmembrane protein n=1 Tax=Gordonia soli NBRC 108243 TaxID=1223545 RepID=M0QMB6_9ACTN|nr:hypothetical protein [Gordonia soli]GAC69559.1 hypothetical protein GS4_26_00060 [Gordonia soli NBRC 108243]
MTFTHAAEGALDGPVQARDDHDRSDANPHRRAGSGGTGSGFPAGKAVLFVAGCVLLVLAAANLTHLGEWSHRWGQIPVFLVFFLVMSIAGRWFWVGADAVLARVIGNR